MTDNARGWLLLAEAEHERCRRRRAAAVVGRRRARLGRAWSGRRSPPTAAGGRPRRWSRSGRPGRERGPAPGRRTPLRTRLGARPLLQEVERLAARARLDLTPPPTSAADAQRRQDCLGLTARELEVLDLVARGYTNREVAAALVISVKTAGVHVTHILRSSGRPTAARPRRSPSACARPGRDAVGSDASRGGRGNERAPPAAGGVERLLGPVEHLGGPVEAGLRPTRSSPCGTGDVGPGLGERGRPGVALPQGGGLLGRRQVTLGLGRGRRRRRRRWPPAPRASRRRTSSSRSHRASPRPRRPPPARRRGSGGGHDHRPVHPLQQVHADHRPAGQRQRPPQQAAGLGRSPLGEPHLGQPLQAVRLARRGVDLAVQVDRLDELALGQVEVAVEQRRLADERGGEGDRRAARRPARRAARSSRASAITSAYGIGP